MKKTTVTESFDENGKIVKRVTVTEEDTYTPYYLVSGLDPKNNYIFFW